MTEEDGCDSSQYSGPVSFWWNSTPEPIKRLFRQIFDSLGVKKYLELLFDSPLRDSGWFRCFGEAPVTEAGEPIPWMPYCFTDFVTERLHDDLRVFEFGSGNSTKWFSKHVGNVVSVEDNEKWFDRMQSKAPKNVTIINKTGDQYVQAINHRSESYDIVVIDGKRRNDCVRSAVDSLVRGGVIIWDDTYRKRYKPGIEYLQSRGYNEVFFQGMGPVNSNLQKTSIFYRDKNCLNI